MGGLLNATFGNAAELIIALAALSAGLHDVVKASIAGSIVGNILLVLGAAMLAGGLRHSEQHFNASAARSQATLLTLAAIALILPAAYKSAVATRFRERTAASPVRRADRKGQARTATARPSVAPVVRTDVDHASAQAGEARAEPIPRTPPSLARWKTST